MLAVQVRPDYTFYEQISLLSSSLHRLLSSIHHQEAWWIWLRVEKKGKIYKS
jgi:hypothetical protein